MNFITSTDVPGIYVKEFTELPTGDYPVTIASSNAAKISFINVKVTARARDSTVPIMTKCWTSMGNNMADMSKNDKIAVIAQVTQGSNPVVGAQVVARIQKDGGSQPIEISLRD